MSSFTEKMVHKYADDLLIGLSNEENKLVLDEFDAIQYNMELISKIKDIDKVEPMTHPFDLYLAKCAEDIAVDSISTSDALSNSDRVVANAVEIPKVVG